MALHHLGAIIGFGILLGNPIGAYYAVFLLTTEVRVCLVADITTARLIAHIFDMEIFLSRLVKVPTKMMKFPSYIDSHVCFCSI